MLNLVEAKDVAGPQDGSGLAVDLPVGEQDIEAVASCTVAAVEWCVEEVSFDKRWPFARMKLDEKNVSRRCWMEEM